MKFTKVAFTKTMTEWLEDYLTITYSEEYEIEVTRPKSSLSRTSSSKLKSLPNISSFEFKPDILGIMTSKTDGTVELVFMNRSISAISLKEVGEMLCYCRLANPKDAFICSPKGAPTEVIRLLLEDSIHDRLLKYGENKLITLFKWNLQKSEIDRKFVFPKSRQDVI